MSNAADRRHARAQAAAAAREAASFRRQADTLRMQGKTNAARALYAKAQSHDRECDRWCKVAASIRVLRTARKG